MMEAIPRSLKLLVVEDEALVAMLVEDALTLHGHRVVGIADTLASALETADREHPDMALCDVKLALGDNGIAVAQALAGRGIPSIFLSGNCPAGAGHPLILGCIAKPFHNATLGDAVNAAYAITRGETPARMPSMLTLY
ncbi:response regulator [Sphingomonadaceae bacterium OTU29MARTA1]|nr:response regulator [Sphingomonadaceae bacterium OTU29LAMAA1]USU09134.1 response regulator [Sphingomonadaceae bacterium OTU29MARTA1]USU12534.1 response regulator [Sphingomonadaceae bacterium OTU29THOMA1]